MGKMPVLCVVGPTATGKTALAVRLARTLGGEIVSMDSMQVYRHMDIGTAKPTEAERGGIPHRLLDVAEPTESFSVAQYAALAEQAIADISARGALPILAGGTGFYLRALTVGLNLGGVKSDPALRERLKAIAAEPDGKHLLHARLESLDAVTAARLHENDVQRVTRAIEVCILTGVPFSRQEQKTQDRPFTFCMIGTTLERGALYRRTDERVSSMLNRGLLNEVRTLLNMGVSRETQAMQGIGYKELTPVLLDGLPLQAAVDSLRLNTRHYAKRQWTWFRAEARVQWLDMGQTDSADEALRIGEAFWKKEAKA